MAEDESLEIAALIVEAIADGGTYTDDRGIIVLKTDRGIVPVAFTVPQLLQLLPQLSGLLGKLNGDSGFVFRAGKCDVARTLGDALRLSFPLVAGAAISLSIPMDGASQLADRIREEATKAPDPPPAERRH